MAKEYRLSIIVTGKDSGASSMLSSIGGSLRSIGTIAGGILTSQVFTAIANQIGQMFTSAVQVTAQMQSMQMMLTNLQARELVRSGDFEDLNAALRAAAPLAEATMDQLERIATLSPYQLENVTNTYKMAMAFGFTAKESTVFTDALLNMAAGVGANGEMLDRMAYNLAQVRMQGKVTAMDIRQLAMAGFDLVDVLKYTGKQMGVNIKTHEDFNRAIEQGTITWEDFTKYFAEYADKNFGGASERMSRTLEGLKSTFKDVFALTMPKILGPAADIITGYLNDILNKFMDFANSGALEQIGQKLADIFNSPFLQNGFIGLTRGFENWAQNINWKRISDDIVNGIKSLDWNAIQSQTLEGAGNIANGLSELFKGISFEVIPNITLSFIGDTAAFKEFASVLESIREPLSNFVNTVVDEFGPVFSVIGATFVSFWETIKPSLQLLWVTFKENLPDAFDSLSEILPLAAAVIGSSLAIIGALVTGVVNAIISSMTALQEAGQLMRDGLASVFMGSRDMLAGLFNIFEGFFKNNSDIVKNGFRQWVSGVGEIWSGMFQTIIGLLGAFIGQAYGLIYGFISGVIGYFQNLYDVLVGHSIIPDLIQKMIEVFSMGFSTIIQIVASGFSGIVGAITAWIPSFVSAIVNMTTTGGLLLGAGLTSMLNVIYMWNSQVVIALQSLKQRFIAEIQQMLQGAVRFIEEKTEWVVTAIATLISAMRRAVKPINITVGLPDWEGLAKEIEEGVAILNAAMKGLKSMSVGVAGAGVAAGGNMGAFGGMRAGGGTKGFAGGGISTGSRSGHWELLHGTEAVIPLERGNVPISLNGGLMPNQGGGVVVNFYHQPMISVGTEREARETIAPIVADVVRGEFQKRGI